MNSKPVSFVTGATGFVGAAVARKLAAKGHELRLLSRANNNRENLKDLPDATIIEGDLTNPDSYKEALKGCDYLFHVAADYRIWVPDEKAMNRVNVEGTHNLMKAALEAGIKKIVYTSSVATLGIPKDGTPGTEDTPVSIHDMIGIYKRSKFMAEEIVHQMIEKEGLPAVIVNPSTPIGPGDIKPTPTGRIILEAGKGKMPAYVDTGLNVVHVDDVAEGHFAALVRGKIGERYILGGNNMNFEDILREIAILSGRPAPKIKLPRLPLYPIAFFAELFAHITKKEPMITIDGLKMSRKKMFFSNAKAKKELDYAPRPASAAIADAYAWFHEHGRL